MSYLKQLKLHADLQYNEKASIMEEIEYTVKRLARLNMQLATLNESEKVTAAMIEEEKEFAPQQPVVKDTEGQVGAGC